MCIKWLGVGGAEKLFVPRVAISPYKSSPGHTSIIFVEISGWLGVSSFNHHVGNDSPPISPAIKEQWRISFVTGYGRLVAYSSRRLHLVGCPLNEFLSVFTTLQSCCYSRFWLGCTGQVDQSRRSLWWWSLCLGTLSLVPCDEQNAGRRCPEGTRG